MPPWSWKGNGRLSWKRLLLDNTRLVRDDSLGKAMRIESIRLKNYKSFRDASIVDMPSLCVVVGANGTGKSTLFGVFGFLKDCLLFNVRHAMQQRGGFREMLSRGADSGGWKQFA